MAIFAARSFDKEMVGEQHDLKDSYAEAQLALAEIDAAQKDLDQLKNYWKEMQNIDIQLEHLFKTIATSFKKIQTSALTAKQANGYRSRMNQLIQQVMQIEQKAASLENFQKEDNQKMKTLERDLIRQVRKLRRVINHVPKYVKRTNNRCKKIGDLAAEAGYWVSGAFRTTISSLRKRGILGNNRPGYYIQPEYLYLLHEIESQATPPFLYN